MDIKYEMQSFMNNCGGEDLIRYLIKEDGIVNWKTIELQPVVAYSPKHMDSAVIAGIAYWKGTAYEIIVAEQDFNNPVFEEWINYLMEMGHYDTVAHALLDHHKAIVVSSREMAESETKSWEEIVTEVIYGTRKNNFEESIKTDTIIKEIDMLSKIFDALLSSGGSSVVTDYNNSKAQNKKRSPTFDTEWQKRWA